MAEVVSVSLGSVGVESCMSSSTEQEALAALLVRVWYPRTAWPDAHWVYSHCLYPSVLVFVHKKLFHARYEVRVPLSLWKKAKAALETTLL